MENWKCSKGCFLLQAQGCRSSTSIKPCSHLLHCFRYTPLPQPFRFLNIVKSCGSDKCHLALVAHQVQFWKMPLTIKSFSFGKEWMIDNVVVPTATVYGLAKEYQYLKTSIDEFLTGSFLQLLMSIHAEFFYFPWWFVFLDVIKLSLWNLTSFDLCLVSCRFS